jgi:hypothetical protein
MLAFQEGYLEGLVYRNEQVDLVHLLVIKRCFTYQIGQGLIHLLVVTYTM